MTSDISIYRLKFSTDTLFKILNFSSGMMHAFIRALNAQKQ